MKMTYAEMIAVLQADSQGETIQARRRYSNDAWEDCVIDPEIRFLNFQTWEYRIKPEPQEWIIPNEVLRKYESGGLNAGGVTRVRKA